jgi:hypothetical protein
LDPKRQEIIGGYKNYIMRSYITHQVKEHDMGMACNTHGSKEECIQDFGRKLEGKRPLRKPRRR